MLGRFVIYWRGFSLMRSKKKLTSKIVYKKVKSTFELAQKASHKFSSKANRELKCCKVKLWTGVFNQRNILSPKLVLLLSLKQKDYVINFCLRSASQMKFYFYLPLNEHCFPEVHKYGPLVSLLGGNVGLVLTQSLCWTMSP